MNNMWSADCLLIIAASKIIYHNKHSVLVAYIKNTFLPAFLSMFLWMVKNSLILKKFILSFYFLDDTVRRFLQIQEREYT